MYRHLRSGALPGMGNVPPPPAPAPEPIRLALDEGAIYISGNKVAIVPALLTTLVVKVVLFGGKQAGKRIKKAAGYA